MRSYLAEEDNDYYCHSPGERAAHSIGLGFITAAAIWVMTALLVRNVWVDANFKKVVVAEIRSISSSRPREANASSLPTTAKPLTK